MTTIREFVIAAHGNLEAVQTILAEQPDWLNVEFDWGPGGGTETPIQAAAHVGNREIATYLLAQGAPLEICTAAMLGDHAAVERILADDPSQANVLGAHGIPLMAHLAFSGDVALAQLLYERGMRGGGSVALAHAAQAGHADLVRWLLANTAPDLSWQNYQGKTAVELAAEAGHDEIVALLNSAQ